MEQPELTGINFEFEWSEEIYAVEFTPLPLTKCYDVEVTFAIHLQWRGRFCGIVHLQCAEAILKWVESAQLTPLPAGFIVPAEDGTYSEVHLLD